MRASELAQLSGLIAANGARFVRGSRRLSESGLQEYWTVSRRRFDCWLEVLRGPAAAAAGEAKPVSARDLSPVLEEVFVSELLTRVWTVLVCQAERRLPEACGVPVVWNVMRCHETARHLALRLMCGTPEAERVQWAAVDALRRQAEHWNDLLLAHLVPSGPADAAALAFDVRRMREFAKDLSDPRSNRRSTPTWQLFQASLGAAFRNGLTPALPNQELDEQIAASILACFPADLFDATGTLRSLWQTRLHHTTADTLAMIEELLATAAG